MTSTHQTKPMPMPAINLPIINRYHKLTLPRPLDVPLGVSPDKSEPGMTKKLTACKTRFLPTSAMYRHVSAPMIAPKKSAVLM